MQAFKYLGDIELLFASEDLYSLMVGEHGDLAPYLIPLLGELREKILNELVSREEQRYELGNHHACSK